MSDNSKTTIGIKDPSGKTHYAVFSSEDVKSGQYSSEAKAWIESVRTGGIEQQPVGGASVTEDYTKPDKEGQPLQTIKISRPPGWKGSQTVTKTSTGQYVYVERTGPMPSPEVQITLADMEKSEQVGQYIREPKRTEQIHETATEFDRPPGQIPKGLSLGLSSVIFDVGETVIGTPSKVITKARELGDQPGKVGVIMELARVKTHRETMETVKFAREEPVAFVVSAGVQLAFFELSFRAMKPLMFKAPKMVTSIEIGKQFKMPKGTYTKSSIFTTAGREKYVSGVDTFVFDQGTSKVSTGLSGIETSRGLSAPLEYRVGVSQSLNLGKVKPTFETTVPTKKIIVAGSKTAPIEMPVIRVDMLKEGYVGSTDVVYPNWGKRFTKRSFLETIESGVWDEKKIFLEKTLGKEGTKTVIHHEVLHRRFPQKSEASILRMEAEELGKKTLFKKVKFTEIEHAGKPVTKFKGLVASPEGHDFNIGVARIQEIGPKKSLVGKPIDMKMIGFSKQFPGKIKTLSSGIADKGQASIMSSIIKTAPPKPSPVMKLADGKSLTVPKPPIETHVQSIAKGLESQLKSKATPKFHTGGFKPIPSSEQKFAMFDETELTHVAPPGTLKMPGLKSHGMTATTTFTAMVIDQRLDLGQMLKSSQRTKTRPGQLTIPVVRTGSMFREDIMSEQVQLHKTLQIQKQVQKTKLTSPTKPLTVPFRTMRTMTPPPTIVMPGRIPFGQERKRDKRRKMIPGSKREFDYTASLTAFGLKIKGKGKKPKKGKMFTGLELRPLFK